MNKTQIAGNAIDAVIPKYTLEKIGNWQYLMKNGSTLTCPFLSKLRSGQAIHGQSSSSVIDQAPCGSQCPHFTTMLHRDKEFKLTGGVNVMLTCGSSVQFTISNLHVSVDGTSSGNGVMKIEKS